MATSLSQLDASFSVDLTPSERMIHLDKAISPYTKLRRQNCAMCYIELEIGSKEYDENTYSLLPTPYFLLSIVNAGCIPPYIKRVTGEVEEFEVGGFALGQGLGGLAGYEQITLNLSKGDLIILTSDGLVEANNPAGQMLGFERLAQLIKDSPVTNAMAMLAHLKREILLFTGGGEQHDDITLVVRV